MNVRLDERACTGNAVDLSDWPVSGVDVVAAIRGQQSPVTVTCDSPGSVHEYVGFVAPDSSLRVRAALAATARELGYTAPQDKEMQAIRGELDDISPSDVDLASLRKAAANTDEDVDRLRERVAALRGRVQALREAGVDASDAESELEDATRELSEVETKSVAANQQLERARTRARNGRDERARRLQLEDRLANLRRDARAALAEAVYPSFVDALSAVPGAVDAGAEPSEYRGSEVTAALAIARLAPLSAPIVLQCNRFESAAVAAEILDTPVVRLQV